MPYFAYAQSPAFSLPDVPVLTIEPDRLYSETLFGKRLTGEIADKGRQLAGENRRIEGDLAEEEAELTVQRNTLPADEFKDLADAFDLKVTTARSEQDKKAARLTAQSEQAQRNFIVAIAPVLEQVMRERGASVILDRRAVFASANASDVTLDAIARIDAELGDGTELGAQVPESSGGQGDDN